MMAVLAADAAEEPDTAHLPNGCFVESLIFVESFLASHESERADLYNLDVREVGARASGMHTIAIFTRAGKLYGRDHVLGDFLAGEAAIVDHPEALEKALLRAYRAHIRANLGARRADPRIKQEIIDPAVAAFEAVQRLTPFADRIGTARHLNLHVNGAATDAVVFAFKGNLVLYRPSVGTLWVPLQKDEPLGKAIRRIPGLAQIERIEVAQINVAAR